MLARRSARAVGLAVTLALWSAAATRAQDPSPLVFEGKILLGKVAGRIDHLAIDLGRKRLLVAELGNGGVSAVELDEGVVAYRTMGLSEPQGVGYFPETDMVYVANGGDGMVRLFAGADLAPMSRLALGKDADNIRVDLQTKQIVVGYGDGGLAVIDGTTGLQTGWLALPTHPEGFRLDPEGARIFVNLAEENEIAVIDRSTKHIIARWAVAGLRSNFAMANDDASKRIFVGFRHPARLAVLDTSNGAVAALLETCGDADDIFHDAKRRRLYVSCGEGVVDVFQETNTGYTRIRQIPTERGARTSLFVPELDRLYVAARATGTEPAAILIYRPLP